MDLGNGSAVDVTRSYDGRRAEGSPDPAEPIARATEDDLKAVFAYLRTIKPITNHVPDYIPAKGQ